MLEDRTVVRAWHRSTSEGKAQRARHRSRAGERWRRKRGEGKAQVASGTEVSCRVVVVEDDMVMRGRGMVRGLEQGRG